MYPFNHSIVVNRLTFGLVLSLILFLLGLSACHHEEHHGHGESTFVITAPLIKDTTITKEYVCQIHAVQHIELRALEKGYLQNIYLDEGDFVKKGQRMFQIMPLLYQAELKKAEAEAHFAEIEYLNTKSLADSNIVSENELALAKAQFDKAKAELDLAQVHLNFTEIKAPFNGIMDRFHVRLGSLVDEGELLSTLSDNSEMWVYFNVPEAEYLDYRMNYTDVTTMKVKLLMANGKLFPEKGKVTTIEAEFNSHTGNIAFRATFPNPNGLLRHGETGNILVNNTIEKALLIPQKTTFEVLDKKYVFVVDESDTIRTRKVLIDAELPHLYAIKEGLNKGDRILLEGLRKVRDGQHIKYTFQEPEQAINNLELYAE